VIARSREALSRHPAWLLPAGVPLVEIAGASAERGEAAIESYGCGSCHTILH